MSDDSDHTTDSKDLPRDNVADDGRIYRSPIGQTILAVGFLILVTLLAFMGVTFIGQFIGNNQVTYWMIELIFALLCGGAGALVGGSAIVRSTLKIPGSPIQATLGGAISMVIVGFAVAYLGSPSPEEQTYALEIQNIPQNSEVDGATYNVFVGPIESSNVSFTRDSSRVTLKIPRRVGEYKIVVAIYQTKKDSSRTFARCRLVFNSTEGRTLPPMQIVPEGDQQFRLYFSRNYIAKVVRESLSRNDNSAVENEPCLEGVLESGKDQRTLLRNDFTLLSNSVGTRLSNVMRLNMVPRYSVLARKLADVDPDAPATDVPPSSPALSGSTGTVPPHLPPKRTTGATPSSDFSRKQVPVSAPESARGDVPHAPAQTAILNSSPEKRPLFAQVDAYIRGDDLDRTRLYQSWNDLAQYVVQGFRADENPARAARYLNLISNALVVIDNGKYLAPTVRPDWDQSVKSSRLSYSNNIPGFMPDDYMKVMSLLCSQNSDARSAAQRLLRVFPSNNFYRALEALSKQDPGQCDPLFVSESAIYFYYNRIVEYDGIFDLDRRDRDWLDENYQHGIAWVKLASAKDSRYAVYKALLDYGYGLVLWDHKDKANALDHFTSMLRTVTSSGQPYPSNPRHLAVAIREINEPGRTSKTAASASSYDASDLRIVGAGYISKEGGVNLFALPESTAKSVGKVVPDERARIYLRSDRWDFIQAGSKFGWARRAVAVSN